ncbi:SulP family inorganic anion transporter [Lewinella sp. LCG006]|uniref:SulP family inorganic anion transporter n=1 Tax=Lewinella sp. LCG006 TaxID=3231911 RepID=UPI003460F18A
MLNVFKLNFSNIRGDFFGGLTAGVVALPLALAFGAQTELGAIAGLYGAIALAVLAAFFGGTATQVSGPTAPMTVVSAAVIASCITESGASSVTEVIPLIIATFFLAGAIEVFFGIIRLGRYIRYIPYPVVSGFMSGIGVIIIITQLFPMLGYNASQDEMLVAQRMPHAEEVILEKILQEEEAEGVPIGVMSAEDLEETARRAKEVSAGDIHAEAVKQAKSQASGTVGTIKYLSRPFKIPNGINWINLLIGLGTILTIYGFKRITTAIPSSLVALVLMTLVVYFFFPGQVPVIGEVQSGLPSLQLGFFGAYADLGMLGTIFKFALTLAALGAIDSLLTSVVADNITKTKHDSDQELIGQGIGNMGAALIGGLPGAGATMRTVININSGGKTKLSGMIAGIFLLAVLLGVGPVVAYVPNAVLAGILFTVGVGIIDYKALRHMKTLPLPDTIIMLVVLFLTVFVDLLTAVGVGMVLAALLFMKSISDMVEEKTQTASSPLRDVSLERAWEDDADLIQEYGDRVYVKHLDGPLFFGFASRFQEMVQALPTVCIVIMRMRRVPYVDQSGLYVMEEAIMELHRQGIAVVFTGLQEQPLDMFKRINLIPGLIDEKYLFENFNTCSEWLIEIMKDEQTLKHIITDQLSDTVRVSDDIDEM